MSSFFNSGLNYLMESEARVATCGPDSKRWSIRAN